MGRHETDRCREIAEQNLILLSQVGSGLHGVTVDNQDDRDEMGICIAPPECVIGLERFDQYQYRTQPDGARSGPGDLDLVIYDLRKWARLAAQGNPTVLLLLFAPHEQIVHINEWGRSVQSDRDLFITKDCGRRFVGYLDAQWDQMLGRRSRRTNRPELIETYGFDTKFAYHAIRLGLQGVELLTTGGVTLPIPEPDRTWLRGLRIGEYSKEEAVERIEDLRNELDILIATADLPDRVNSRELDAWIVDMHRSWWESGS